LAVCEHRRGLVLGLTLAEILILLLFLLMLALGARMSSLLAQVEQSTLENDNLRAATASLKPLVEALNRSGSVRVDDIRDLVERMGRLTQLEKGVEELRRKNADMEAALAIVRDLGPDATQKLRALDRAFAAAARIDPTDPPAVLSRALNAFERMGKPDLDQAGLLSDMSRSLGLTSANLKPLASAMATAAKIDPNDPAGALKRSLELTEKLTASGTSLNLDELVSQLQSGKDALANAVAERDRFKLEKDNLVKGGRGLMYPSCWIAPNGDTEYMFDIKITDTGLTASSLAPAYRNMDEAWKQIDQFPLDREISETQFRNSTVKLNSWSRERECRFVVIMRDATGLQSKERYKQLQRLIEAHFYVRRMDLMRATVARVLPSPQTEGRGSTSESTPPPAVVPPRPWNDPGRVQ
jgi:hypothetical protein